MDTGTDDNPWHTVLAAEAFVAHSAFARTFDRLPLRIDGLGADEARDALRALGFEVGEPVEDPRGLKPLFVSVTPPEGWRLRPLQDPVFVDVVDAFNVTRAQVFHKPDYHDRRASLALHPRFGLDLRSSEAGDAWRVFDREAGESVFDAPPVGPCPGVDGPDGQAVYEDWAAAYTAARDACKAWLDEHHPDRHPLAYWSDLAGPAPAP